MMHLDRRRAAGLMDEAGIDALLLTAPESFTYATGASPGVGTMWRRAGAIAAIVPADPALEIGAVVSDLFENGFRASSVVTDVRINPLWVETADLGRADMSEPADRLINRAFKDTGRVAGFMRPETFDAALGFRLAGDILQARGLAGSRIAVELDSLSVTDFACLNAVLPNATLVDATDVLRRLKMVKSPGEIACLRTAVSLAETGIEALQAAISPGMRRDDLAKVWTDAVYAEASRRAIADLTGTWEYVSVGVNPWTRGGTVEPGALIKVDVGCLIAGYTSDTGRTFVCGTPSTVQSQLFDALQSAFAAGLERMRPGNAMREVHRAATVAMAKAGFPGFTRGHFGHGLGAGLGSEEWPFFSATSMVLMEPGMVLAFETPWYVDGVGGMIIENQLVITPDGYEVMNRLPTGLVRV